ncbi:hypothetical protein GPS53_15340 [Acinetobacter haemolyticus]|nr:hypothetical protein [Acinetobacter haemolyticus]
MKKRLIYFSTLVLGCSSWSHAAPSYGLGSAETMAHLVNEPYRVCRRLFYLS